MMREPASTNHLSSLSQLCILSLALVTTACWVPSFNPLFAPGDLVSDPSLVGAWECDTGNCGRWTFESADGLAYELTVVEDGAEAQLTARLGRLDGTLFLETIPEEWEVKPGILTPHLVPHYSFARVVVEDEELKLVGMSPDWLEDQIESGNLQIDHRRALDDVIVLTASTDQLQRLVSAFRNDPDAFPASGRASSAISLRKVKSEPIE